MLYPPILNSFQAAFTTDNLPYQINFQLSNFMTEEEFQHVQIYIVYQSNNQTIVDTNLYPDGIIYKDKSDIVNINGIFSVSILAEDLIQHKWETDTYYRVQIRFGSNALWENKSDFANWKANAISNNYFSEWSTVMILKSITTPNIIIKNNSYLEYSTTPIFYGNYINNGNESEDLYKFELYKNNELIEESQWLQHNVLNSQNGINIDQYRFKTVLINNETYSVVYYVQTVNYYIAVSDAYTFRIQETSFNELNNITFIAQPIDEDGCVDFFINSKDLLSGNYIISRKNEKDDYASFEDIYSFSLIEQNANNLYIYTDYSIENGVNYKYFLTKLQIGDIRSLPLYDIENPITQVNFEHSYLVGNNGIQLKLKYNTTLSSFKHSTLSTKQTPLGGKYPIIQKNGNLYYAEFPINSLISIHSDENQRFFIMKEDGYYYNNNLVIPIEKIIQLDTNLTKDNLFIEKIFRDKVEEFLNSEEPKLFKSPTEGNYIVSLMNTSLSPNTTINRFIYNFSTTANEVMEFNLENLKQYNIISYKGSYLENKIVENDFNQLFGFFESSTNLIEKIKEKINIKTEDFSYNFKELKSFQIQSNNNLPITIIIDGQEIFIPPNRIYALYDRNPSSIILKQSAEIIIDFQYIVEKTKIELNFYNFNFIPYTTWNQISGNYNTISLFDTIVNNSKLEIENLLNEPNSLTEYDENLGIWTNIEKTIYFLFLNIDSFDLEAPEGTQIELEDEFGKKQVIIIGSTNRFNLNLQNQNIRDIKLLTPANITLNYTSLVLYGKEGNI